MWEKMEELIDVEDEKYNDGKWHCRIHVHESKKDAFGGTIDEIWIDGKRVK